MAPHDLLLTAADHHRSGRLAQAEPIYRHLLTLDPNNPHVLHLLGVLCHQTDRNAEAVDLLRRAISLNPRVESFHCNLGMVLAKLNRFPEAIAELKTALMLSPESADAYGNLANVYKLTGEIEQAVDMSRRANALRKDPVLASAYLYLLHLHPAFDAPQIAAAHRAWRTAFAELLKQFVHPHANTRDPNRRLRIGFVLPLLSDHPVVRFLLPYLQHHRPHEFEITLYYDTGNLRDTADIALRHIRPLGITLQCTAGLDDEHVAHLIRTGAIDILIDVAMHTENNRLLLFARKPAPVQITWLAYAGSTGLDTIDYRLTDPYLDPPGSDLSLYSEHSLYLESFWCYWPPPEAPPVGPLPMLSTGQVTFGCLNNYAKVSRPTLDLWTAILLSLRNSRLLLYCPEGPGRARALAHFSRASIDPSRISFAGPMKSTDYFSLYNHIDIALDPFPYAGGTTTCDALYMGLPVITLTGRTAVSRAGSSILHNAGLPQLVTTTPEAYRSLAASLASDPTQLSQLRSNLRPRLLSSTLCNAPRFTHVFERILRQAWAAYCQTSRPV